MKSVLEEWKLYRLHVSRTIYDGKIWANKTLIFSEVVPVRLLLNMQEKLEIIPLQKETEGVKGEFWKFKCRNRSSCWEGGKSQYCSGWRAEQGKNCRGSSRRAEEGYKRNFCNRELPWDPCYISSNQRQLINNLSFMQFWIYPLRRRKK